MQLYRTNCTDFATAAVPQPCAQDAPSEVNVYTDGSLVFPGRQAWHLAGFGTWWPARAQGPTVAEEAYMEHWQEGDGLGFFGSMVGQACSSTRAELTAGIAAVLGPGPVHIGSDSAAFVGRAQRILRGEPLTFRRPWSLQRDGDLWQCFEQALLTGHDQATRAQ